MKSAIFLTVDKKFYALGVAQARHVARLHSNTDVHLFVEHEGIEKSVDNNIEDNIFIHVNKLDALIPNGLKTTSAFPKIVYGRLFAPFILDDYERLLFLDADVLVLDNLDDLIHIDIGNNALALACDVLATEGDKYSDLVDATYLPSKNSLGLDNKRYFNAGVQLINRQMFAQADLTRALNKFITENAVIAKYPDQDFINVYFRDNLHELSPKWNYQSAFIHSGLENIVNPSILHFTGRKPWHRSHWFGDPIFADLYEILAENAGFKLNDFPLKEININKRPKRTLIRKKLHDKFGWMPNKKLNRLIGMRLMCGTFLLDSVIDKQLFSLDRSFSKNDLARLPDIGFNGKEAYFLYEGKKFPSRHGYG